MRQVLSGVLSVMFVIGLAGVATAGMMDTMKGKADEASKAATDPHQGMDMKEAGKEAAIETKSATQQKAGGMMDQLKEGAKGEVNQKSKEANETIDKIGK